MVKKLKELLKVEIGKVPRPFGIYLSGGLDSGILAALSKPNFAITCNFNEGEKYDELEHANKIARHLGIPLKVIQPRKEDFKVQLETSVKIIGKPINSVSIVPWYNLMKEAVGMTMLNGEGADELFGGYSRYIILNRIFEMYNREELRNYIPTLDFLFKNIHSKLIEVDVPHVPDMKQVMETEFNVSLPDILLMEKKLAEHFKVDFHQPFLSEDVVNFANKVPLEHKIKGFTTKVIIRKLAKNHLPKEVVSRRDKKGMLVFFGCHLCCARTVDDGATLFDHPFKFS